MANCHSHIHTERQREGERERGRGGAVSLVSCQRVTHLLRYSQVTHSLIHSFIRSFVQSLTHSFNIRLLSSRVDVFQLSTDSVRCIIHTRYTHCREQEAKRTSNCRAAPLNSTQQKWRMREMILCPMQVVVSCRLKYDLLHPSPRHSSHVSCRQLKTFEADEHWVLVSTVVCWLRRFNNTYHAPPHRHYNSACKLSFYSAISTASLLSISRILMMMMSENKVTYFSGLW